MCVCVRGLYHEEDLLQPLDTVFVPGRADVDAAGLAANQMLRQQHDETLREEKQHLKVCVFLVLPAENIKVYDLVKFNLAE